jgi:thiamine-phosphate pyrophosphorylase
VASLLIPAEAPLAQTLAAPAQAAGVAVLIEGDWEVARKVKADGVMIDTFADYTAARSRLGGEAIVGASCASRHAAMELAEAGADFIFFAEPRLAAWWSEVSVVPCVGGDEFRVPDRSMWHGPAESRAAVAEAMKDAA